MVPLVNELIMSYFKDPSEVSEPIFMTFKLYLVGRCYEYCRGNGGTQHLGVQWTTNTVVLE